MDQSFLPTQGKPLCLKRKDGRNEAAQTDDPIAEVNKSDRSGWDPEVQHVDDELFFGSRLSAVIELSMDLHVNMKLSCAYAWRPRNLDSRSTAELTFRSAGTCCKREISAATRWVLNAALMMLRVIPESQYLLAVLFTLWALSGVKLMNLIVLAQTIAS